MDDIFSELLKKLGGREFKVAYALHQRGPLTRLELSNITQLGKWRTEQMLRSLLFARVVERQGEKFVFTPERIDWKKLNERTLYRAPSPAKTLTR